MGTGDQGKINKRHVFIGNFCKAANDRQRQEHPDETKMARKDCLKRNFEQASQAWKDVVAAEAAQCGRDAMAKRACFRTVHDPVAAFLREQDDDGPAEVAGPRTPWGMGCAEWPLTPARIQQEQQVSIVVAAILVVVVIAVLVVVVVAALVPRGD